MFGRLFTGRVSIGIEGQDSANNHVGMFSSLYNAIRALLNIDSSSDLVYPERNSDDEEIVNLATEEDNSVREFTPLPIEGDNHAAIAYPVNSDEEDNAAIVSHPVVNLTYVHASAHFFPNDPGALSRIDLMRQLHETMGGGRLRFQEAIDMDNNIMHPHAEVVGVVAASAAVDNSF